MDKIVTGSMIEDVILEHDDRGMTHLREYLPSNFCESAAHYLHEWMDSVAIVTGFYVSGFCETDGPVSAVMLGEALMKLGSTVTLVTDRYCYDGFKKMKVPFNVYNFPMTGEKESRRCSEDFISSVDPSILISIERCGRAKDGKYYNMQGEDISQYTAKIDTLFDFPYTIGIGDGGNEIGMGNIYNIVKKVVLHGEKIASIVKTTHLIISSVSNWGVYGLLAYLSLLEGEMLLKKEDEILTKVMKAGAIDSASRKSALKVDGFSFKDTNIIIEKLLKLIQS